MTVGTGKEKKITAGKSDQEKRLQPLKLDPISVGYGPGDRKWTVQRTGSGQGEKVTEQRRFNLHSTGLPEVFKAKETHGVPSWPWQRQN